MKKFLITLFFMTCVTARLSSSEFDLDKMKRWADSLVGINWLIPHDEVLEYQSYQLHYIEDINMYTQSVESAYIGIFDFEETGEMERKYWDDRTLNNYLIYILKSGRYAGGLEAYPSGYNGYYLKHINARTNIFEHYEGFQTNVIETSTLLSEPNTNLYAFIKVPIQISEGVVSNFFYPYLILGQIHRDEALKKIATIEKTENHKLYWHNYYGKDKGAMGEGIGFHNPEQTIVVTNNFTNSPSTSGLQVEVVFADKYEADNTTVLFPNVIAPIYTNKTFDISEFEDIQIENIMAFNDFSILDAEDEYTNYYDITFQYKDLENKDLILNFHNDSAYFLNQKTTVDESEMTNNVKNFSDEFVQGEVSGSPVGDYFRILNASNKVFEGSAWAEVEWNDPIGMGHTAEDFALAVNECWNEALSVAATNTRWIPSDRIEAKFDIFYDGITYPPNVEYNKWNFFGEIYIWIQYQETGVYSINIIPHYPEAQTNLYSNFLIDYSCYASAHREWYYAGLDWWRAFKFDNFGTDMVHSNIFYLTGTNDMAGDWYSAGITNTSEVTFKTPTVYNVLDFSSFEFYIPYHSRPVGYELRNFLHYFERKDKEEEE